MSSDPSDAGEHEHEPDRLTLRPASAPDLPDIAEVYLAARVAATMPPSIHPDDAVRAWVGGWDLDTLVVWVAETEAGTVGFAAVRDVWLESLYVDPGHAGAGVGSALLDLVKGLRPDGFDLWVFEVNEPARAFYAARGLVEVARTDGRGNEERAPDIQLSWPGASG